MNDIDSAPVPQGDLALQTMAMPRDTNASGDIFGGWLLSQMDLAGGIAAGELANGRVATVAITAMTFHLPVYVGDVLCVYTEIEAIGRTSITMAIEAWALRRHDGARVRVTEGRFVFVALGADGRPRPVLAAEALP